ncbi:unnamed protein product [Meganyctiphanes norvegica]|uniref:MBD domain-containing protein n=1 Tax=Meganyctiphanes norvegica TaxID=48144 RepID=A0AAV2SWB1_MEGNR
MGSGENCDDEFECSECDFKCTSEIDIKQHSAIHHFPIKANEYALNINPYGTGIEYDSREDNVVNLQSTFSNGNKMLSCSSLADTPETNVLETYKYKVKVETSLFEDISTTEIRQESEIGNKKIKLEDIDIKEEIFPNYADHQINKFANIHRDQDFLGLGSIPSKNKLINGMELMHSAPKNVNISTNTGHMSAKTIAEESGASSSSSSSSSSSCQSEPSHGGMSLTIDSQCLPPCKRPIGHRASFEVEIDNNTSLYIPPGWSRKLFLRTNPCKGQLRYDCYYYTESGKRLNSKTDAYEYANKKYLPDVDIEKRKFSASQTTIKPDQLLFEVDLDNTGIYIPEGWQRKQYLCRIKMFHIRYLNEEGKRFRCKADVYAYLSHSDRITEKQIDVEEMDFFTGAKSQSSLKNIYQSDQETRTNNEQER